jgi:hypothetical protein
MREIRRLDLLWHGDEVPQYERLKKDARDAGKPMPQFVKMIIERAIWQKV